ncbi:MAG: hydroxymethylbilane synthase [Proteobacteria bacterium]|nr:hydroxymethylbilane synthase [Pseudomonadota bacterium]
MGLVIGSRGSALALWQSEYVAGLLQALHGPDFDVEIRVFSTRGDRIQDRPLPEVGGKGLFTAELEAALLGGDVDLAVHSLKDLPTELPEGLGVVAVPLRADARDALVLRKDHAAAAGDALMDPALGVELIPEGGVVGTSSVRRIAQIRRLRPDLECKDVRGNVPTRLRKLDEGGYDALLLACAGLDRLDLGDRVTRRLDGAWLGAPGQGAIGIEGRAGDMDVLELVRPIEHKATRIEVEAERTVLAALEGGCSVPLAATATASPSVLAIEASVLAEDGSDAVRIERRGESTLLGARRLGRIVARELIEGGALALLDRE